MRQRHETAGMTLRDHYATTALHALILADKGDSKPEEYAQEALDIANAVLAQRAADRKAFLRRVAGERSEEEYDYDGNR